jgi:hypothetical protein
VNEKTDSDACGGRNFTVAEKVLPMAVSLSTMTNPHKMPESAQSAEVNFRRLQSEHGDEQKMTNRLSHLF